MSNANDRFYQFSMLMIQLFYRSLIRIFFFWVDEDLSIVVCIKFCFILFLLGNCGMCGWCSMFYPIMKYSRKGMTQNFVDLMHGMLIKD